ncbi:MAG: AMP-binding protein [Planctomycetes bacterium]|nr:AMP-binding protein [Planctomycetota bacterium]
MNLIHDVLRAQARATPDRAFLLFEGREFSCRELDERSDRVAARLVHRGVRPGDNVAVLLDNRPEFLLAWFGILKAGAALVPINPALKPPEIDFIRTDSESRLLLTAQEFDAGFEDPPVPLPAGAPADTAAIVYTSGTTGKPKGAVLTHDNYLWDARAIVDCARMTADDRFLCILPLFHVNAQVVTTLAPLVAGGSMVLMRRFSPLEMLQTLAQTGATAFSGVPTIYGILLNTPGAERYDLSRLRFCVCGAAPMPREIFEAFEARFKARILEGYGLTESTCASSINPLDRRKLGSIGRALPGQEMAIEDGEIVIRGPNIMRGYYKNPTATAETLRGGWLHTGDLGRVDEEGYYYIIGRKKEMINRGGEKVYPKEVEEVLYTHPAVAEAAVVGVPDAKYGEEVAAYVVRKAAAAGGAAATAEDLLAFCRERLADYKGPKRILFRDSLPKTATGKIQKHLLGLP